MVAPERGFSGSDKIIMVRSNLHLTDPCCYGIENWEIFTQISYNLACTRSRCAILLARSRGVLEVGQFSVVLEGLKDLDSCCRS